MHHPIECRRENPLSFHQTDTHRALFLAGSLCPVFVSSLQKSLADSHINRPSDLIVSDFLTGFSILTGFLTVASFLLQVKGSFPKYSGHLKATSLFLLGATIGLGASSITGATMTIQLPEAISVRNIVGFFVFGGAGVLVFLCFGAMTLVSDDQRRVELSKVGSAVSGFLIFMLVFFVPVFFPAEQPNFLTYEEQIELVVSAAKRQNYDRAILLLEDARKSLRDGDPRIAGLDKLESEIRDRQAALPSMSEPFSP